MVENLIKTGRKRMASETTQNAKPSSLSAAQPDDTEAALTTEAALETAVTRKEAASLSLRAADILERVASLSAWQR